MRITFYFVGCLFFVFGFSVYLFFYYFQKGELKKAKKKKIVAISYVSIF